jgi:hypothetical protein
MEFKLFYLFQIIRYINCLNIFLVKKRTTVKLISFCEEKKSNFQRISSLFHKLKHTPIN